MLPTAAMERNGVRGSDVLRQDSPGILSEAYEQEDQKTVNVLN